MIDLPSTGYIQVRAYTSYAQIPLKDVAISVTASDGTAIAMRLTDRNGQIAPIEVPVPDLAESQSPDPGERPFAIVNLYARLRGYEQIEAENLQVFAGTTTDQNLEMIPLSELPSQWDQTEIFDTPPQNL
ncbi:MAG: spore cortex-lytic protein [Oscillospiraceae bacterium]|nr:spore cortex-lytic protein [Oscillospiraceae bacterium]